jgi:mannosyltransferase OCH1-like enzyme
MDTDSPEHHRQRSEFIRKLVQHQPNDQPSVDKTSEGIPRTIIQYWDNPRQLPDDVKDCLDSWSRWETNGYRHRLFNEKSARVFISRSLSAIHEKAFDRCYHPAMQADYFRLCFLMVEGGLYVDADDVCKCTDLSVLFEDDRLKAQPLCYDLESDTMIDPAVFLRVDSSSPNWIFYLNNNPLAASRGHRIIKDALNRATNRLNLADKDDYLEIQSTTGPGNFSKSVFELGAASGSIGRYLSILRDWENIAVSKWPLSYRDDSRNWRLSNQRPFHRIDV